MMVSNVDLTIGLQGAARWMRDSEANLVWRMREAHALGMSYARIARVLDMHPQTVARTCKRGYLVCNAH